MTIKPTAAQMPALRAFAAKGYFPARTSRTVIKNCADLGWITSEVGFHRSLTEAGLMAIENKGKGKGLKRALDAHAAILAEVRAERGCVTPCKNGMGFCACADEAEGRMGDGR